ncbi:hypothetical protein BJ508DRAFT_306685 [Ascobolus immersus RN42]|uniref:Uncharacterized protein n=1 Tax=Ascobolus immersus RN42 TaxID=1160509 RepID=A0A3N4IB58_ASCIM|nr:hypothetical protein BJ508DRAFT_306685 [Ascobolus immersus RN42]
MSFALHCLFEKCVLGVNVRVGIYYEHGDEVHDSQTSISARQRVVRRQQAKYETYENGDEKGMRQMTTLSTALQQAESIYATHLHGSSYYRVASTTLRSSKTEIMHESLSSEFRFAHSLYDSDIYTAPSSTTHISSHEFATSLEDGFKLMIRMTIHKHEAWCIRSTYIGRQWNENGDTSMQGKEPVGHEAVRTGHATVDRQWEHPKAGTREMVMEQKWQYVCLYQRAQDPATKGYGEELRPLDAPSSENNIDRINWRHHTGMTTGNIRIVVTFFGCAFVADRSRSIQDLQHTHDKDKYTKSTDDEIYACILAIFQFLWISTSTYEKGIQAHPTGIQDLIAISCLTFSFSLAEASGHRHDTPAYSRTFLLSFPIARVTVL